MQALTTTHASAHHDALQSATAIAAGTDGVGVNARDVPRDARTASAARANGAGAAGGTAAASAAKPADFFAYNTRFVRAGYRVQALAQRWYPRWFVANGEFLEPWAFGGGGPDERSCRRLNEELNRMQVHPAVDCR